ncbi:uncharacterized protein C2orf73 homolog [Tiliqua scincoides]|uniref:uncharacterized protein C2orf73 homolog n=1 Tax=Tiliqua scincoides TaxID=71010 RepID=UPI003461DCB2
MYRITEMRGGRRKKAPPRRLPDSFRTFNIELPGRNNVLERIHSDNKPKKQEPRYILEWRNNPQPQFAKCITSNARFFNEPIIYMITEDTKDKQDQWWPSCEPVRPCPPKPPYDKQSTQRTDFQKPSCRLSRPVKYSSTLLPSQGIVPLACPRTQTSLPRIFQEQLSFKYQYNSRATPCVPYQGKKLGSFIWTEITPKGETVLEGMKTVPCAEGSGSLGQPKTEKGHSVESCMTSPLLDSQETPDSSTHLSKTDISEGAKTEPRASEKREESAGNSQTTAVSPPCGEAPSKPPRKGSPEKLQDPLPPVPTSEGSSVKIQAA